MFFFSSRQIASLFIVFFIALNAFASQAGWRQISLPSAEPGTKSITVAMYYPTLSPEKVTAMGPYKLNAAINAPPTDAFKGLIVLSHGTGGTELGHNSIAEALARHGYLVAALRHPGDNWQDTSLLREQGGAAFFSERPKHVSRVIDGLLRDAFWSERLAKDAKGYRIGALGHSAGGYTVLALAGGQATLSRLSTHCQDNRQDDPIFCSIVPTATARPATAPTLDTMPPLSVADARVRVVVALSPLGVPFAGKSLAAITSPVLVYFAEHDRYLVPKFHAGWIEQNMPSAQMRPVANAWHFAFMDAPSIAIPTPDGNIGDDPPMFDRAALLQRLGREIPAFFDQALQATR